MEFKFWCVWSVKEVIGNDKEKNNIGWSVSEDASVVDACIQKWYISLWSKTSLTNWIHTGKQKRLTHLMDKTVTTQGPIHIHSYQHDKTRTRYLPDVDAGPVSLWHLHVL